jgi:hypothetical protein
MEPLSKNLTGESETFDLVQQSPRVSSITYFLAPSKRWEHITILLNGDACRVEPAQALNSPLWQHHVVLII